MVAMFVCYKGSVLCCHFRLAWPIESVFAEFQAWSPTSTPHPKGCISWPDFFNPVKEYGGYNLLPWSRFIGLNDRSNFGRAPPAPPVLTALQSFLALMMVNLLEFGEWELLLTLNLLKAIRFDLNSKNYSKDQQSTKPHCDGWIYFVTVSSVMQQPCK